VFSDANGNGTFDPDADASVFASGVSGVTVYADLDGDSTLDANEPTASQFGTITLPADGTYTLRAVAPAGFTATSAAGVPVTVTGGEFKSVSLGLKLTAGGYLTGTVYYDADGDGTRDAGEDGFGGTTAGFSGTGVSVYVDANGNGSISNGEGSVAPGATGAFTVATPPVDGSYIVRATAPAFATVTEITPGRSAVSGGATGGGVVVGVKALTGGLVRGSVFLDADGSGTQNGGEGGVPAGSVFVYDDADGNGVLGFTETSTAVAADGSFALLTGGNGSHRIRLSDSFFGSGNRKFVLSTAEPAAFDLSDGTVRTGVVFGGTFATVIEGVVFDDVNGNGLRDVDQFTSPTEPGLAGVAVYADLDGDGTADAGEPTAVTDANGFYELTLAAGATVTVRAVPPAGR